MQQPLLHPKFGGYVMLNAYPFKTSQDIAISTNTEQVTYGQLYAAVSARVQYLRGLNAERVALLADNCDEWVYFDLACQFADCVLIPVPVFFSEEQREHLFNSANVQFVITQRSEANPVTGFSVDVTPLSPGKEDALIPQGTVKVTFTSGSTGAPKGVCLSSDAQFNVADSLAEAVNIQGVKHLAVLPLSLLLENIAGIYSPLLSGGQVILATAPERGFEGSRLANPERLLGLISSVQPNTLILVPELLQFLVVAASNGWQPPSSLQFIAVGGGLVSSQLLTKARHLGLPVYQGYGLSECCSVVALNTPSNEDDTAVGACLKHNNVTIENNEIVVSGSHFLGYLNDADSFYPMQVATGDLGQFENGFLRISGRRKHLIINSWGRNISPEWIEAELFASGAFQHVVVTGDAKPYLTALYSLANPNIDRRYIDAIFHAVNERLPDYARVFVWEAFPEKPSMQNGCLTATGKPVRQAISQYYDGTISPMYFKRYNQE